MMKRFTLLISVLAAAGVLLAPPASARLIELGSQADAAPLNCPGTTESPCQAAVRMTGLPGSRLGRAQEPVLHPQGRPSRRVHRAAGEADRGGDQVLRGQLRHAIDGPDLGPAPRQHPEDAAGPPPDRSVGHVRARPLLRLQARRSCSTSRSRSRRATGSRSRCRPGRRSCPSTWRGRTGGARRVRRSAATTPKSLRQFAMEDLREVSVFGCTYHGAPPALHRHVRAEQPRHEPGG